MNVIKEYRRMLNIQRLSGTPKLKGYDLAQHSYYVALLYLHFARKEEISVNVVILEKILKHDLLEIYTGDLPWPAKNLNDMTQTSWMAIEDEISDTYPIAKPFTDSKIKQYLNEQQLKLFKVIDLLELWIFCKEEITLGNASKEVKHVEENCVNLMKGKFESVDKFIKNYDSYEFKIVE